MVRKLALALLEKQTSIDTPETVLAANDFTDNLEAWTGDISPTAQEDLRGSGVYGNNPRTIGRYDNDVSLVYSLYSRGSGVQPSFIKAMECAGWERRLSGSNILMVPKSEITEACTLWGYEGGPGTNKSLLEKWGNIMFDGTISIVIGERATMTLNGKGKRVADPVISTMPDVGAYREKKIAPAFMEGAITINGVAYNLIKLDLNFGQTIENNVDGTDEFGGGDTEMTDRNIEFTCTVYQKPTLAKIPHSNLKNQTSGTFDLKWGRIFNYPDLRLYSTGSVFYDVKRGDNNGVSTWELSGYFQDNEIQFEVYNNNGSSYSSTSVSYSSDSNSSSSESNSSSSASESSASSASL